MARFSTSQLAYIPELELKVYLATSFWARLVGLMGLPEDEIRPLLISGCRSIHTVGMRCAVDVVFLHTQKKMPGWAEIVALHEHLRPGRIKLCMSADSVLEIWAGGIGQPSLTVGQNFVIDDAINPSHGGEIRLSKT